MTKTAFLFDLDGTLLPIDQDEFVDLYFQGLRRHFDGVYDGDLLIKTIWAGTKAMALNDGQSTNADAFWNVAERHMGITEPEAGGQFIRFYETGFEIARGNAKPNPEMIQLVRSLKAAGHVVVAATNPMFPQIATRNRLRWAGFEPEEFDLITTYEDFHYSKPNPGYYSEILERIGKAPEECAMIGNDNQEDMCAEKLGIDGYLITDWLINRDDAPIECKWSGSCSEFVRMAAALW